MPPYIKCILGGSSSVEVPTWADGTDEEIVAALQAHYNNEINLNDYWTVGDERVVHLDAMTYQLPLMDTQPEQDVTLVLVNQGGAELTTPINGHTECAFIVGQKEGLYNTGPINYNKTGGICWGNCDRSIWCDQRYLQAIPSTLRSIFKAHKFYAVSRYDSLTPSLYSSYTFRLPSLKELGFDASSDALKQYYNVLEYYNTPVNRIKYRKGVDNPTSYWTISRPYGSSTSSSSYYNFYECWPSDNVAVTATDQVNSYRTLAPQGVI